MINSYILLILELTGISLFLLILAFDTQYGKARQQLQGLEA